MDESNGQLSPSSSRAKLKQSDFWTIPLEVSLLLSVFVHFVFYVLV